MRVEILGAERRRRWDDKKNRDIVVSVGIDGATVSEVAHCHVVARQQIDAWRRELKKGALLSQSWNVAFVPVEIPALRDDPVRGDGLGVVVGMIELKLNCGEEPSLRWWFGRRYSDEGHSGGGIGMIGPALGLRSRGFLEAGGNPAEMLEFRETAFD